MKLFLRYINEYRRTFILFLIFSLIFAVIFALYEANIEAVLYAFVICIAVSVAFIAVGFIRFQKKHIMLRKIYINLPLMTEKLPAPDNITQEDLIDIITRLAAINQKIINDMNNIRRDSSDYFTVWVHQIKTPISAMQMILQNDDTDVNRELSAELFKIEQYAEMALNYIRLDSSSNDFVIKYCNLDSVIRKAVRRYAPLFIRRKVRLSYSAADTEVLTDKKWLLFIIEQLLSNAVKYTYSGTVSISYADYMITISDTGIGISPEDLPRIFEKGYTGLSGRTESKSTGLGLYLCQKVCTKLGHKISVNSEVGEGTTFTIDLSVKDFDIE